MSWQVQIQTFPLNLRMELKRKSISLCGPGGAARCGAEERALRLPCLGEPWVGNSSALLKRKNKKLVKLPQIKGTGCPDRAVSQRPKKRAGWWLGEFYRFPFYQSPQAGCSEHPLIPEKSR